MNDELRLNELKELKEARLQRENEELRKEVEKLRRNQPAELFTSKLTWFEIMETVKPAANSSADCTILGIQFICSRFHGLMESFQTFSGNTAEYLRFLTARFEEARQLYSSLADGMEAVKEIMLSYDTFKSDELIEFLYELQHNRPDYVPLPCEVHVDSTRWSHEEICRWLGLNGIRCSTAHISSKLRKFHREVGTVSADVISIVDQFYEYARDHSPEDQTAESLRGRCLKRRDTKGYRMGVNGEEIRCYNSSPGVDSFRRR